MSWTSCWRCCAAPPTRTCCRQSGRQVDGGWGGLLFGLMGYGRCGVEPMWGGGGRWGEVNG